MVVGGDDVYQLRMVEWETETRGWGLRGEGLGGGYGMMGVLERFWGWGDGFIGGGLRDDGQVMGGVWDREVFWKRTRGRNFSKESAVLGRKIGISLY